MSTPQITDERLRCWLDGQQLARERMCLAVLSLDKRFRLLKPRNPRGGRDGGRDVEATYEDGREVWIAVGFQNSVSDSKEEKKQAHKKFKSDLNRAKQEYPTLSIFIFFSNITLTTGERDALIKFAINAGMEVVDIFDRERIRIALDSPDGFAFRFQYLGIPLSDAEQAAFFGRWGSEIESLITNSITAIESRLSRLEFFLERNQPLLCFGYQIVLNKAVSREELGHFRVDFNMHVLPLKEGIKIVHLGLCDDRGGIEGDKPRRQDCMSSIGWITIGNDEQPKEIIHKSHGLLNIPIKQLSASMGDNFFRIPLLNSKLGDLEGNMFAFFVNQRLAEMIDRIFIFANEYIIWAATQDEIYIDQHDYKGNWPYNFSEDEMKESWIRIMSKRGSVGFDFSETTPYRLYRAKEIEYPIS